MQRRAAPRPASLCVRFAADGIATNMDGRSGGVRSPSGGYHMSRLQPWRSARRDSLSTSSSSRTVAGVKTPLSSALRAPRGAKSVGVDFGEVSGQEGAGAHAMPFRLPAFGPLLVHGSLDTDAIAEECVRTARPQNLTPDLDPRLPELQSFEHGTTLSPPRRTSAEWPRSSGSLCCSA